MRHPAEQSGQSPKEMLHKVDANLSCQGQTFGGVGLFPQDSKHFGPLGKNIQLACGSGKDLVAHDQDRLQATQVMASGH